MPASQGIFRFYRHVTAIMLLDGTQFLIDPMYRRKGRLPPVPSVLDFRWNPMLDFPGSFPRTSARDVLLITHHHFDHFDRPAAAEIDKGIRVVTPVNGVKRLRRHGFENIFQLNSGRITAIDDIEVVAVPVKHTERWNRLLYRPGLGYLLKGGDKSVYISGDTVLFDGLFEFLQGTKLDLAILYGGGARIPFLGRHTFSHREVIEFVEKTQPELTIVTHLDCLNHCRESGMQLDNILKQRPGLPAIVIPRPGRDYPF